MPFAGERSEGAWALAALAALRVRAGDERLLVDNCGALAAAPASVGVQVVRAEGERSPAHARNAGAAVAAGEWILFLDADTIPPPDLLERYFAEPVASQVGALAGEVTAAPGARTLAGRYAATRGFLSLRAHLHHPYRPRAAAANLLVRRSAFEQLGGFCEGLRAGEDTDFCWRLQGTGWRLEPRARAVVEHRYRSSLGALRSQWRAYAAGRAWLARRHPGFRPEPAALRALRALRTPQRLRDGGGRSGLAAGARGSAPGGLRARVERARLLAVDLLLAGEELVGLLLANRPAGRPAPAAAQLVLVAERFPAGPDSETADALRCPHVRVEARARPRRIDRAAASLPIAYREDDGWLERRIALARLLATHPLRVARDRLTRPPGAPALSELAAVLARLERDPPTARLRPLGGWGALALTRRLARLSGRPLGTGEPGP
jgi:hypothetical protein